MNETWRPVSGFERHYEVSSLGNVRRSACGKRTYAGRLLRPRTNPEGYQHAVLSINGVRHTKSIHRLVAQAFIGDASGREVNHIDGVKSNNAVFNLEIVSRSENQRHAYRTGLHSPRKGAANPFARLSDEQVREIRSSREPLRVLAKRFGVHLSTVHLARTGKSWSHVQ